LRAIVLETSGAHAEAALADHSGLLARRRLDAARKHARDLAPAVRELLSELGWRAPSIDLVVVDLGPGSYTGLRVGVMTAKTLAYATSAAVVGVDAMAILAEEAPSDVERICAVVDAQQGLVYAAEFQKIAGEAPRRTKDVEILSAEAWAASLPPGAYATGPALSRFGGLVPSGRRVAPPAARSPTVEGLWRTASRLYLAGARDDLWSLEPLYLRPSSAEQKWDAKTRGPDS
jgi:tRNA threonylcarbamoyladenosine biosynthesis protein TsaB